MARIVGYIASSLDGFIADPHESLAWLTQRADMQLGEFDYNLFIQRIRTVVMGRGTYDWLVHESIPWPYAEQRTIVVTSRPPANPIGALETRTDIDALVAEMRALDDGDVWMLGGGKLQMAFMERGALDEIEIYVISQLLGGGYPLFPPTGLNKSLKLLASNTLGTGCVRLHYSLE